MQEECKDVNYIFTFALYRRIVWFMPVPQDIRCPGDLVKKLLAERQWTQDELADIMGRSRQTVNDIIGGRTALSPETAKALAGAFGNTFAEWWMLEGYYQESLLGESPALVTAGGVSSIIKRAPIKEMQRRGWLSSGKSFAELEPELKAFYRTDNLDEDFNLPIFFKRTLKEPELNRAERAWVFRAIHLAKMLPVGTYKESRMINLTAELRRLAAKSKAVLKVPDLLGRYGIRFLVIEPLRTARIDGAAFWLTDQSPVVALSLRFDNIGSFWFALMHELMHIKHRDSFSLDSELDNGYGQTVPDFEERASAEAAEALVPQAALNRFIRSYKPFFSTARINNLATQLEIHPGIIVGQLQHKREIGWNTHRDAMVKVRELVTLTAFTDGWGHPLPQANYSKGW